jgi:rod shape determining protein RodA
LSDFGLERASVGHSSWHRYSGRFDWPLFTAVLLLVAIGLLNLYSALSGTRHEGLFVRQIVWMTMGLAVYAALTVIDYRFWQRFAWMSLGLAIFVILLVYAIGVSAKGAQRWLGIGFVSVQPSELAKIAVILALARLTQDAETTEMSRTQIVVRLAVISTPVLLILLQPDLGSATLTLLVILSVGFMVVQRLWALAAGLALGLAGLPLFWETMHPYQRDRVLAFLDPDADPTGIGWHTRQSILAVGAGRVTGEGYMNGTQTQFKFLPEHWTDFPFSVLAEEWGFVGCLVLLSVLLFCVLWLANVALSARDPFGAVICLGFGAMLFWHTIVNIAMVLGLAPVVGVTLPFISYGGSSALTFFIGLGLVSSVSARRHGF